MGQLLSTSVLSSRCQQPGDLVPPFHGFHWSAPNWSVWLSCRSLSRTHRTGPSQGCDDLLQYLQSRGLGGLGRFELPHDLASHGIVSKLLLVLGDGLDAETVGHGTEVLADLLARTLRQLFMPPSCRSW